MHNALPINFLHFKRDLAATRIYSRCHAIEESQQHDLKDCEEFMEVWHMVGTNEDCGMGIHEVKQWLHHLMALDNCSLYCATLWWIWRPRNKEVLGHNIISIYALLHSIRLEVNA